MPPAAPAAQPRGRGRFAAGCPAPAPPGNETDAHTLRRLYSGPARASGNPARRKAQAAFCTEITRFPPS